MDVNEIQELCAFAAGYKRSLEERGCTNVTVEVVPDDNVINSYFMLPTPIKSISVDVKLIKPVGDDMPKAEDRS